MQISQVVQRYHNPDPLLRLVGPVNEATVIVEGQRFLALIDSGTQLSTMSESSVQSLKLPVHKLNTLIGSEASGGGIIPYVGYVEARLAIPGIKKMDKDSLFMVSNNSPYTNRVPIQIGTLHIREALQLATNEEKEALPQAWETANFPPQTLAKSGILKEPEFDLNKFRGHVKLTKSITIGPFQTVHVSGLTECNQHFKRVNVIVEPDLGKKCEDAILIHGYTVLKPGSSKVPASIRNLSCRKITIPTKLIIAKVVAANIVPHSYAPNIESSEQLQHEFEKCQQQQKMVLDEIIPKTVSTPPVLTPERESLLFSKIDLDGAKEWSEELKVKTKELFREYAHIFALESLDMGHTSMVKHKIKLDNYTPLKERYRHIPPNVFDEVKNCLKEMIQIGAIRCSNSPWASAVVLVRKKDWSL